MGELTIELNQVREYEIFNFIVSNADLTPPEIEILAPTSRDVAQYSNVDITVKLTDNENIKKTKLFLDYIEIPESETVWTNTQKEREHTFLWTSANLIGLNYLTIYTEDEAGNKASKLLALNISPNPNDKTKPNIEILNPTGDKISRGASVPFTVKATDDNTVMHINVYINEIEVAKSTFNEVALQREKTFFLNTAKFPNGTNIVIKVLASDANYNWGKVYKTFTVEGSNSGDFLISGKLYSEKIDLDSAILVDYGSEWRMADWQDLLKIENIQEYCQEIGVQRGYHYYVKNKGERFWSGTNRHYFISRFDHEKPVGYLAHDQIDNNFLCLGSWFDENFPILLVKK